MRTDGFRQTNSPTSIHVMLGLVRWSTQQPRCCSDLARRGATNVPWDGLGRSARRRWRYSRRLLSSSRFWCSADCFEEAAPMVDA